jgi:hypothetical protein
MNTLLIEKQTGGYFKFTLNGDTANAITSINNDLLAVGNQLHFKTGNGANIIKEQFIYPADVTIVSGGTFTFTTVAQVWDKLIAIDYFTWLGGGGTGGVDRFDDLLDTFSYTGNAGKAVVVDNSELKLVPITLYNKRLFTELEDTPSDLVPNKMLVVNPAGTAVVLQDQPSGSEEFLNSVGYFDYNDLATQTTPLSAVANVALKLTNDTEGANTSTDQNPYGVSYVWDYTTNQFNFSELEVGDTIDVRVHVQVTTTTSNQKVSLSAKFGIGSVAEFTNSIFETTFKTSGLHEISFVAPFYMGSTYITDYPAELYLTTDASATVKVDGWYVRILRKNINIVTVDYQVPDASTTVKGIVRLAGDLAGTANNPTVPELANKVPTSRTITINGFGYDLTSNVNFTIAPGTWGQITGALSNQTDLQQTLNTKEGTISGGTTSQYWRGDKSWQNLNSSVVGLGNVDNTTDLNKPISIAAQTALDAKVPTSRTITINGFGYDLTSNVNFTIPQGVWGQITGTLSNQNDLQQTLNTKEGTISGGTTSQYWRGDKSWQNLNSSAVGLANVDNTTDLGKPISTATQTALDLKVPTSRSITINGVGYNLTADVNFNIGVGVWGQITGTLSNQTDLYQTLNTKMPADRAITINGVTQTLTQDRSWTISAGIGGTGTNGYVAFWNGTSNQAGDSNLFWDNTNKRLGIGTISPSTICHLYKASYPVLTIQSSSYQSSLGIDTSSGTLVLNNESNGALAFNTNATERMRITSGGQVQISSPISDALKLTNTNSGAYNGIIVQNDASNQVVLGIGGSTVGGSNQNRGYSGTVSNIDYYLMTNNTERMRITSGGNVLIGTTTDNGNKLNVNGSIYGSTLETYSTVWNSINVVGPVPSTSPVSVFVNSYPNNSSYYFAQYGGNWSSAGNWGLGPNGSNDSTIYLRQAVNGVLSGTCNLNVTGIITASGGFFNSDIRLKDIISRDEDVIEFTWKDGRDNKKHIGVIAQEVQKLYPDMVQEGTDEEKTLSVNYIELLVLKNRQLEKRIESLEKLISNSK